MSKPILIIRLPRELSQEKIDQARIQIDRKINDWHVLTIISQVDEPQFECYHIGNATEIQIEDFKKIAMKEIQSV